MLSKGQRKVGKAMLSAVAIRAKHRNWTRAQARQVGRIVIMAGLTESELRVDGNTGNPDSERLLAHFAAMGYAVGVGHDHASVGPLQQQVPSWGTNEDCMNPVTSAFKFLNALNGHGQDVFRQPWGVYPDLANRVQMVQVSAYSDGSNYRRNRYRSGLFIALHWNFAARAVK